MTQKQKVKKHLEKHGKITSMEAFRRYNITRISAIIYDLRHEDGLDIDNVHISKKNKKGEWVHYDEFVKAW